MSAKCRRAGLFPVEMKFRYALDERLKIAPLLMYGLQWLLMAIPVVLTSTFVARLHYDAAADQIFYIQKLFFTMGVAIIVQVLWGHRLPLMSGPAAVLIIGVVAASSASVQATYTAIAIGGVLLALLAASGWLKRLQPLFTPRVIIVILALIAFTIMPVFMNLIFGSGGNGILNFSMAIMLALLMVLANKLLPGLWKSTVVLLALAVGSVVYYCFEGWPAGDALAVGKPAVPLITWPLEVDVGTIIAFLFCYVALLVNELGSIQSVAKFVDADHVENRSTRGVVTVGLINALSGMFGVVGHVDYSFSPGIISASGCASRYALMPAGVGLVVCAMFPEAVGVLSAIPSPVMGTVLMYLMAAQLAAAFQMVNMFGATSDFDGGITVGLPVMLALVVALAPAEATAAIPSLLKPIVGNGFVMGVLFVLLLEHVVFRKRRKSP